jgi:hypothetical protein
MVKHHGVGNGKYYEKRYNKMKNKIIIATLLFAIVSCKSQIKNTSNNMEKFNEKDYKNLIIDNKYSPSSTDSHYISGNNKIGILYFKETIQVVKNSTEDNYEYIKSYRINDKSLKIIGQNFYNFPTGIWLYYDEKWRLTKEINYDKDYKFSIDDLATTMKVEYKIDILKRSPWVKVMRDKIDSGVIYKVMTYLKENKYSDTKNYTIDGTTGKVISEKVLSYPKE